MLQTMPPLMAAHSLKVVEASVAASSWNCRSTCDGEMVPRDVFTDALLIALVPASWVANSVISAEAVVVVPTSAWPLIRKILADEVGVIDCEVTRLPPDVVGTVADGL